MEETSNIAVLDEETILEISNHHDRNKAVHVVTEDEIEMEEMNSNNNEEHTLKEQLAKALKEKEEWKHQYMSLRKQIEYGTLQSGYAMERLRFPEDSSLATSPNEKEKSLFRLLQCSDEMCEIFRPAGRCIRVSHHSRTNTQCFWEVMPKKVLIVKKPRENRITDLMKRLAEWLLQKEMTVYVEPNVIESLGVSNIKTWSSPEDWEEKHRTIDFIVCLGGDGTILWATGLFQRYIPPIVSFALGSLGFLTPFDIEQFEQHLSKVLRGGYFLSLRSRIECTVRKNRATEMIAQNGYSKRDGEIYYALNEIVVDRGALGGMTVLDCYCDGQKLTRTYADGIIIATPTGSTAYSLSAGGSMVHPSVPTMLFTPICPHSLSFRPLLFHDSASLEIVVPDTVENPPCLLVDGKHVCKLEKGYSLYVKVSSYPVPIICLENENTDWFISVKENLNWNQRKATKPGSD